MVAWQNLFQAKIAVEALVGQAEGFLQYPDGTNVQQTKPCHGIMVEVDKDRGLLGIFLREQNQGQVHPQNI